MEVKTKNMLFTKLVAAVLILMSLLSASSLLIRYTRLDREKADFRKLSAFSAVSPAAPVTAAGGLAAAEAECAASPPGKTPILARYAALYEKNHDMIGWLEIAGTGINYPVMFTPADGDFYIDKDFEGQQTVSGSLFADGRSSFKPVSDNIIIYGHNMKNGAMFGALTEYRDKAFFNTHRIIRFDTVHEPVEYEVIAVFYSRVYKKSENIFKFYNFIETVNEQDFDDFISKIKSMSIYETGVTAVYGDTLITLVTCAYHVRNGRFVVIAKNSTGPDE